ncbi:MAG: PhzF family phenazine biosynthesis protein [Candidatus Hydrogenedentes bacterium]|nr:PhzF family phenazine biosynthesis protein [Candidatus Hydrogenedentota bacterium]
MEIPVYQVDAFTSVPFRGNPAAICPLDEWIDDNLLQRVAAENNLSETAYFVKTGNGYELRWFTPTTEVDLCGHATLASAHVLFSELGHRSPEIAFDTKSGRLVVKQADGRYEMDFPSRKAAPIAAPTEVLQAVGVDAEEVLAFRNLVMIVTSEDQVRAAKPDFGLLKRQDIFAAMVTAKGSDCDFVSRFFAPAQGIDEDPVTGAAHCTLTPYWAEKLGKTSLFARQVSNRGGEIWCEDRGERVMLSGAAVTVLKGTIYTG